MWFSLLTALTTIVTLATGAPLPNHDHTAPFLKSVAGTSGSDRVSIIFDSPCSSCFGAADTSLKFALDVDRADNECTGSGVRLNGVDLVQTPSTDRGSFDFGAVISTDGTSSHAYVAEWSLSCLDARVSLLHVQFSPKTDDPRSVVGGFSTSFQQTRRPWILKLDPTSFSSSQKDLDSHAAWVSPGPEESLRIGFVSDTLPSPLDQVSVSAPFLLPDDLDLPNGLEDPVERLWKLKLEKQRLHSELKEVAGEIFLVWKTEIARCNSLTCYVQKVWRNIHFAFRLIVFGFQQEASVPPATNNTQYLASVGNDVAGKPENYVTATLHSAHPLITAAPNFSSDQGFSTSVTRMTLSSRSDLSLPSSKPEVASPSDPSSPQTGAASPYPLGDADDTPGARPSQSIETASAEPTSASGSLPAGAWLKGELEDSQKLRFYFQAAIMIFAIMGASGVSLLALACIKYRNYLWQNPRIRADCMARREERKRRKAYRKAACKHRLRTFIAGIMWWKSKADSEDDLEKEEQLLGSNNSNSNSNSKPNETSKERNEGSAFDQELAGFRLASELVGELFRAEEGRSRYRIDESESDRRSERASSIAETLPSYSEPPEYSSGYTPSRTEGSEEGSESSVADCSSRMSFDTHSITTSSD